MITEEIKNKIYQLRQEGKSILKISIELRIGKATVCEWCKRFDPEKKYNHTYKNLDQEIKYQIINKYIEFDKNLKKTSDHYKGIYGRNIIRNIVKEVELYKSNNKIEKGTEKRIKSLSVINWKKDKKLKLVEYKGGKCEICGYDKCYKALDFHHKDPTTKEFDISSNSFSFEKMKLEADKCILICSNCHRELHHNETLGLP